MGRGSSGIGGVGSLKPIKINPAWAYQPDDQTDLNDMVKNPIPFVGVGEDMRLAELFDGYDTKQSAWHSEIEVNINDLKTLQPFVLRSGITNYRPWEGDESRLPFVIKYHSKYYLIDGNHRAAIAKLQGKKTIKVMMSERVDKK